MGCVPKWHYLAYVMAFSFTVPISHTLASITPVPSSMAYKKFVSFLLTERKIPTITIYFTDEYKICLKKDSVLAFVTSLLLI